MTEKVEQELLLTPEKINELALSVYGEFNKHTPRISNLPEDYVKAGAEAQLAKVLKHRLDRPKLRKSLSELRLEVYGAQLTERDIDEILALIPDEELIRKDERERITAEALKAMSIYDTEIKPNPYTVLRQALKGEQ